MTKNLSSGFLNSLMIIGIIGFLFIGINEFTDSFLGLKISSFAKFLTMIILGIGVLIEGKVRLILDFFKDRKLSATEISHIFTIGVGFLVIIAGITYLFAEEGRFVSLRMSAVGFGLLAILLQRFVPQK